MTIKAIPSKNRLVESDAQSAAARWGFADWIVPGDTDIVASDSSLSGAPLNEAAISTSGLDVTIDTFEAFIGGSWVGSDDNTASEHTHTLAGSSTTTTLYLGYDQSATDTVIFGPSGDFAGTDPKVPIGRFTDDGSSVTASTDLRPVGLAAHDGHLVQGFYDADDSTGIDFDTGTMSQTFEQYRVILYRETQEVGNSDTTDGLDLRLNGITSTVYQYDWWDGPSNTGGSSRQNQDRFEFIGVIGQSGAIPGTCYQEYTITYPTPVVSNGRQWPLVNMVNPGSGLDAQYLMHGHLESNVSAVDRIHIFDNVSDLSTGFLEIYGESLTKAQ